MSGLTGWGLPVAYPNLDPSYGIGALYIAGGLAIIGVLLGLAEIISIIRNQRKKLEPWHLMTTGLGGVSFFAAIAFVGMIWQHYSPPTISETTEIAPPSSTVAIAETKPSKPTRHLSSKDKDNIANALNELSAITEKRLKKMVNKVDDAIRTWRNSPASERTTFVPEMQKTLTDAGAEAQSIAKYVRDVWLQENLNYRDELAAILTVGGEQQAMGLVENFSGEAADFNRAMDAFRILADENSSLVKQESAYQLGRPASDKFQKSIEELRTCINNLAAAIKTKRDEL
jgi:hypothetical protein